MCVLVSVSFFIFKFVDVLISHVSIVLVRLISQQQLDSFQSCFQFCVNQRVSDMHLCQRFDLILVPHRCCCALGALRKSRCPSFPVCLHTVVVLVHTM